MLTSWQEVQQQLESSGIALEPNAKLTQDSRQLFAGDLFVAIRGTELDGSKFIPQVLEKEASVILVSSQCEPQNYQDLELGKTSLFVIENLEFRLPEIAKAFYLGESGHLPVLGVTGTNGKTSISYMLAQMFRANDGSEIGVIGTMGIGSIDDLKPSNNTTPGVTDVYRIFRDFKRDEKHQFSGVIMEVSSHALQQNRVKGVNFDVAIFTNLTLDHLDYHGTMEEYFLAKTKLFTEYAPKNAIVNFDDEYGRRLTNMVNPKSRLVVYGQNEQVKTFSEYVFIESFECHSGGLQVSLEWQFDSQKESVKLDLPIYGEFNCSNLAAVFASAKAMGWHLPSCHFSRLTSVPGRLELFTKPHMPVAIVDYAHTPDALEQSLAGVRAHLSGRLFLIFGCGGDRDSTKRPIMGKIAESMADIVIVTNDNPRTEAPAAIVEDIKNGFQHPKKHRVIFDRKEAIRFALQHAAEDDAILIAGKGHETYQIIGQRVIDYDEREFTKGTLLVLSQQAIDQKVQTND